jgi:hypothetical protein
LHFLEEMSKSIADQREVDPGHQVGFELGQVDVEGAGWSDDWDWRSWSRATDIEIATANVYMENNKSLIWAEFISFFDNLNLRMY